MGTRIKTFDATGVAPNGRLFAGDLNLMQDQYADQSNFTQTLDVGTLRVGDGTLQLLKYGAGEFRLSGALRTDGILRGLSGLFAGAYTTAQRDAIAAGSRPYGLIILNTTTNQLEWNQGTDAAPIWAPLGGGQPGDEKAVAYQVTGTGIVEPEPGWLYENGVAVSRTTYARLFAKIGTLYGVGDGVNTFNLPDCRGRMDGYPLDGATGANRAAGFTARGTILGADTVTLALSQIPSHSHGGVTGLISADHTHAITTGTESADHTHGITDPGHTHTIPNAPGVGGFGQFWTNYSEAGTVVRGVLTSSNATGITGTGGRSAAHTHSGTTSGVSVNHTHSITAEGGGGSHSNVPPVKVTGAKLIRY